MYVPNAIGQGLNKFGVCPWSFLPLEHHCFFVTDMTGTTVIDPDRVSESEGLTSLAA